MTIYVTKVWGFSSPTGPLQFSERGWREKARKVLRPGDLVILVGTQGEETLLNERGKILGMMEPTTEVVSSLDFELTRGPRDYNDVGEYKWPYGLLIRRAWRFLEPLTYLSQISSRQFHMDAALGIVPLTPDEATGVMQLPKEDSPLLLPSRAAARIEGADAARRRGAPPPTTTRVGIMHLRRAPAFTYAMEIRGASEESYKIGWAFDFKARQRQFNLSAMPQLGGLRYQSKLYELWETAYDAYSMEQAILRRFDEIRHPSNREVLHALKYDDLQAAWLSYMRRPRTA